MPFVFSHVEYCDMHFVYGFCNGSARTAVEEHRRRFPDRRIPSSRVFTRIHVRNHPDIASAIQTLLKRAENCLSTGGGHFEQLL